MPKYEYSVTETGVLLRHELDAEGDPIGLPDEYDKDTGEWIPVTVSLGAIMDSRIIDEDEAKALIAKYRREAGGISRGG
jgi:hypothetical protein